MRYAKGQEETLKNCTQRRVKAGHLPKKCSDVSSSSWHEGQVGDVSCDHVSSPLEVV